MKPEAGRRDRLVLIQQLSDSKGASNYPVETWTDLAHVWAAKEDVSGRERFAIGELSAPYDTKWTIPWMDSMNPDAVAVAKSRRLIVLSRIHDIVYAREIGRRVAIELMTIASDAVHQ